MDDLGTSVTDELFIRRAADFSPCQTWRYTLRRTWDDSKPHVLFILLNPSTADAEKDDPTNRRGIGYAMDWGFGGVVFCNLFAFRTPNPWKMKQADDPIGPDNNIWIGNETGAAGKVVVAWGAHGVFMNRDAEVSRILSVYDVTVWHLGLTKRGQPKHILYLSRQTPLQEYELQTNDTADADKELKADEGCDPKGTACIRDAQGMPCPIDGTPTLPMWQGNALISYRCPKCGNEYAD